jgi:hypothetical protein
VRLIIFIVLIALSEAGIGKDEAEIKVESIIYYFIAIPF